MTLRCKLGMGGYTSILRENTRITKPLKKIKQLYTPESPCQSVLESWYDEVVPPQAFLILEPVNKVEQKL